MQFVLSRIRDVFEIKGRGCVIWPGISSSSNIRVRIGDSIVVVRPDGSSFTTQVRGIEMFTRAAAPSFIPILLDESLTKADLPIGSDVHFDVTTASDFTYTIDGLSFLQFASTFLTVDEGGHIRFGWSAVTIHAATPEELLSVSLEFRDYIMEGFVSYLVSIQPLQNSLIFRVGLLGLTRDVYVRSQLEHYFRLVGIAAKKST